MTEVRVLTRRLGEDNFTLTYDSDDVENVTFSTPNDVIDVTRPEDTAVRRELGQAHLDLHIDFKPGKRALWVKDDEALGSTASCKPELEACGKHSRYHRLGGILGPCAKGSGHEGWHLDAGGAAWDPEGTHGD